MKYFLKYTLLLEASTPKRNKHPKEKNIVKNPGYKINFDLDVIYTKHMLIIYFKII